MEKNLPKPPELPELPKPDEKLLPAPTFDEKYGWLKPILLITVAIICIDIGIFSILHSESKQNQTIQPQNQTSSYHYPQSQNSPAISSSEEDSKKINWKTYTNQPGRFSLKYPPEYTLAENSQMLPNTVIITSNTLANINTDFKISIHYQPTLKNETLEQLIDQNKICPTISSQTGIAATFNQVVNGKIYKDVPCQQSFKTIFYTENKNLLYIITIDTQEKFDTIKQYTDQIFSTFQFIQ